MRPFLRGFADELIKIAGGDPWSDIPRPPSTATGYEQAPKPQNALPPSNAAQRAIPKQRMEWSPSASKDTWQPSPGFKAEQPKAAPAPKPTSKGAKPVNADPAWENAADKFHRVKGEQAYNAGLASKGNSLPSASATDAQRKQFFAGAPSNPNQDKIHTPGRLRGKQKDLSDSDFELATGQKKSDWQKAKNFKPQGPSTPENAVGKMVGRGFSTVHDFFRSGPKTPGATGNVGNKI